MEAVNFSKTTRRHAPQDDSQMSVYIHSTIVCKERLEQRGEEEGQEMEGLS